MYCVLCNVIIFRSYECSPYVLLLCKSFSRAATKRLHFYPFILSLSLSIKTQKVYRKLQHVHHEYAHTSRLLEDRVQIWRVRREKSSLYAHDMEEKYGLRERDVGSQSEPHGIP